METLLVTVLLMSFHLFFCPPPTKVNTRVKVIINGRRFLLTKQMKSALSGLVVAVITALVAFGVIGGEQASAIQGVIVAAISFVAAVGIRSALPPKN